MNIYIINIALIMFYGILNSLVFKERKSGTLKNYKIKSDEYHYNQDYCSNDLLKRRQKVLNIVIAIQLFVLSAFKGNYVGTDMQTYGSAFYTISGLSWDNLSFFKWEYGYVILNKVVSMFYYDFRYLIYVVSLIVIMLFSKYIYDESKIQWLSFYLFICMDFFSFTLSGYRQAIAMAITIFSIKYIKSRKLVKFIMCISIASLFHQSAMVFLLIYPISKIKISKKYILIISLISILTYSLGYKITNFLLGFYNRKQIVVAGEGFKMFFMLLLITIGGLLFFKYARKKDGDISLYCHMMILAVFLQVFSLHLSIFVRVVSYYSIHMIIFIPNIISSISSKQLKYLSIFITCVLAFGFYLYTLSGNSSGTVPYYFMWENFK